MNGWMDGSLVRSFVRSLDRWIVRRQTGGRRWYIQLTGFGSQSGVRKLHEAWQDSGRGAIMKSDSSRWWACLFLKKRQVMMVASCPSPEQWQIGMNGEW